MPDAKLSALTAASSVADSDLLYIVQGGASKSARADVLFGTANIRAALAAAASPSAANPLITQYQFPSSVRVPATTSGRGSFNFEFHDAPFLGVNDPIWLLGYNGAFSGDSIARLLDTEPALFWGIEGNYNDGSGDNKMEAYLEFIPTAAVGTPYGVNFIRPLAFQFNRDTGAVSQSYLMGDPVILGYPDNGTTEYARFSRSLTQFYGSDASATNPVRLQFYRKLNGGQTTNNTVLQAIYAYGFDGTNYQISAGMAIKAIADTSPTSSPAQFIFSTTTAGATTLTDRVVIDSTGLNVNSGKLITASGIDTDLGGRIGVGNPAIVGYQAFVINNGLASQTVLAVQGKASQSGNLLAAFDQSGNTVFAVEPDGDIRTARTAAATTLGSVAAKLAIYNAAGTLVGYVPLYDAIS